MDQAGQGNRPDRNDRRDHRLVDSFAYMRRRATVAAIEDMVAPLVVGQEIQDIPEFNRHLQQRLHLHGRYGITTTAISAPSILPFGTSLPNRRAFLLRS